MPHVISIAHGFDMLEKSVKVVTVRHHKDCRVMPNSDQDAGWVNEWMVYLQFYVHLNSISVMSE